DGARHVSLWRPCRDDRHQLLAVRRLRHAGSRPVGARRVRPRGPRTEREPLMDPLTLGIVVLAAMLVVVLLGLPVGYALLGAGTIGYAVLSGPSQALTQVGLALWDNGTNFLFIAVPLFILMGQLIFHAGLAEDIFSLAQRALRRLPGGLGVSTVLASAGFGAVTGSSVAAVATMGNIAVPQMIKRGYSDKLSTATVASAATLAIIIPPSVPLVIYGVWSETSIGSLFIAGIVPGLVLMLAFVATVMLQRRQYAAATRAEPAADRPLSAH